MKVMASMKRKRWEVEGKVSHFKYHGHDLQQEKIERGSRRLKQIPRSPESKETAIPDSLL